MKEERGIAELRKAERREGNEEKNVLKSHVSCFHGACAQLTFKSIKQAHAGFQYGLFVLLRVLRRGWRSQQGQETHIWIPGGRKIQFFFFQISDAKS